MLINSNFMNIAKYFTGALFAFILVAQTAGAAQFATPEKDGDGSVAISGEARKNLYTAGNDVTVSAPVTGDLYAAAGDVVVNADIEQDLNVAGGDVTINGKVGGDVRIAGGKVILNGVIGGDLIVAGGHVILGGTSSVGGDLIAGAGRLKLEGPVTGSARLAGGEVTINNRISGTVWVQVDSALHFGPSAVVSEKVTYKGKKEAVINDGAEVSNLDFQRIENKPAHVAKAFLGGALLIQLLAWFVAGWLLVYFLPNRTRAIAENTGKNFWVMLGWGFVGLIIFPVAVVALLFSLIGYYVAFIVLAWYVLALAVTCLLSAIVAGAYVDKWLMKRTELHLDWQSVIIGVVLVTLAGFIPIFGWVAKGLLFLAVFGSLLNFARTNIATYK